MKGLPICFSCAYPYSSDIRNSDRHKRKCTPKLQKHGLWHTEYINDFKEGIKYLKTSLGFNHTAYYNKQLYQQLRAYCFAVFKSQDSLGVMTFTFVTGANPLGRLIGGLFHYKDPQDKKFTIAMFVYVIYPNRPRIPVYAYIRNACLAVYIGLDMRNIVQYSLSSTQNYLPDTVREGLTAFQSLLC